jgi:hypothetical protein
MVLEHAFGRTIIPIGKWSEAGNIPSAKATHPMIARDASPACRLSASRRQAPTLGLRAAVRD